MSETSRQQIIHDYYASIEREINKRIHRYRSRLGADHQGWSGLNSVTHDGKTTYYFGPHPLFVVESLETILGGEE